MRRGVSRSPRALAQSLSLSPCQVVSPHYAAMAALGPRQEEVDLADKLIRSWDKYSDDSRSMALIKLHRYKQLLQKEQKSRF